MLIHTRSHLVPSFHPPMSGPYNEALRLCRHGDRLDPADLVWYLDALFGRCRSPNDGRLAGVTGISVRAQHVMVAMLNHASADWLVHLPRGVADLRSLTGHGDRALRGVLQELADPDEGPQLLHVINGKAAGQRVFQILEPPLTSQAGPPIRRPATARTANEKRDRSDFMFAVHRVRTDRRPRNGGPNRKHPR